jgi:hypothetical protein
MAKGSVAVDWRFKLIIYSCALSAAYADLIRSLAGGIGHPPLYWAVVGSIVPLAALGIRNVYKLRPFE